MKTTTSSRLPPSRFSRSDGRFKFALSAPLFGPDRELLGVSTAGIGSDDAIGRFPIHDPHDRRRTTVLAVPRDRQAEPEIRAPLEGEFVAMIHEGIPHGAGNAMFSATLSEVAATCELDAEVPNECLASPSSLYVDEHHVDPVRGFEGEWLAGFAQVGCTGHVVIVQTRREDVAKPFWWRLAQWAVAALLGMLMLIAIAALVDRRRRSRDNAGW